MPIARNGSEFGIHRGISMLVFACAYVCYDVSRVVVCIVAVVVAYVAPELFKC